MKILALERELPQASAADFAPLLKSEALRAWELLQSGSIREIYFRQDQHSAVIMLECADLVQAQSILSTLPLVSAGLIAFDLIPLVAYPGFSRLFAEI